MRRGLVVLAIAVVAAGCSSDHKTATPTSTTVTTLGTDVPEPRSPQERAVQECAKVAPKDFANAKPTTVGAIHAITGGPSRDGKPVYGYAWILKGLPPQSFAAWCWRKSGTDMYHGYVVGPNGEVVDTGQGSGGAGPPPPGPMQGI
jgi:hypothetical protein